MVSGGALRVLLIEDNSGDAALIVDRLASSLDRRFQVTVVPHLRRGIDLLRSASFDVLIADLTLPDATPAQTIAEVAAVQESVAIVVMSGSSDDNLRREALNAGAQDYLTKGEPATLVLDRCLLTAVERHRGQAMHRQLERWMSVAPEAVIVASEDGLVHFVNAAAERLFGRSRAELMSESIYFSLEEGNSTEIDIWRGKHHCYGELRVVPVDWRGAPALLASIRDTTDRRNAEAQLAAVDRLVSIGTLAASVAHEISSPIAAMIVNLELAARASQGDGATSELHQLIADTREAADRVRAIAADLRIMSRTTEERTDSIDLQRVVASAVRLASHETQPKAPVVVSVARELPMVQGQESRICQVLLNLLVNAAQAIPDGAYAQHRITVASQVVGTDTVEITVADTGCGMGEEVRRRLFSPFFTTKPAELGTGLGLSICKRIVEDHGGQIEVESEIGAGSTFRIRLPSVERSPPSLAPTKAPFTPTKRARILIVDDEPLVSQALSRALHQHHDVHVVNSATSALAVLERDPAFDVILSDVLMPGMTGPELYRRLAAQLPQAAERMVFLSGVSFSRRLNDALDPIPNRKLKKPLNLEALLSFIQELLAARA